MASRLPPTTMHMASPLSLSNCKSHSPRFLLFRHSNNHFLCSQDLLRRSSSLFLTNPSSRSRRCLAASPGPRSPPESDPPTGDEPSSTSGLAATLSRFQDSVQIFFAVLFWMSLFFWASAWDGRNNGRLDKGRRFRR